MSRYCVVKNASVSGITYDVITLFDGETIEPVVDGMDGSLASVVKRDGQVVTSAGEICSDAFFDREQARVLAGQMQRVLEVMES